MQEFHFSRQFRHFLLKPAAVNPVSQTKELKSEPGVPGVDVKDEDGDSDVESIEEDPLAVREEAGIGEMAEELQPQKETGIESKCVNYEYGEEEFMGLILFGIAVTEKPSKVRLTCKCFDATTESMRALGIPCVVNVGKSRHDEYDEFDNIAMHGSKRVDEYGASTTSVPDGMHERIVEVMKDHAIGVLSSVQKAADSVTLLEKKLQGIIEETNVLREKKDLKRTDSLF
jgi:hypothetical protein